MAETTSTPRGQSKQHCCVPYCVSDSRYDNTINFHRIPKDPIMRKQWIVKIRRDEGPLFRMTQSTVVCSKHFKGTDYTSWTPVRRRLKPEAVPSIFDWTSEKGPRRALKRKRLAARQESLESITETSEKAPTSPQAEEILTEQRSEDWDMKSENDVLKQQLKEKITEGEDLKNKLEIERFGIERFSKDNSLISFYTGFSSYTHFLHILFLLHFSYAFSPQHRTCKVLTTREVKHQVFLGENGTCF